MNFKSLREALEFYRENNLVPRYGDTERYRSEGLLRRQMIDHLCDDKPTSVDEFYVSVPTWLLKRTSKQQIDAELPRLMRFVRNVVAFLENRHIRELVNRLGEAR